MTTPARRCPLAAAPAHAACPDRACRADPAVPLPREGPERALVLALRFVAAARETGDAACFDAAFAEAEAAFGPRDGALLVARAVALLRAARREGVALVPLVPACRSLSADEAGLLAAVRALRTGRRPAGGDRLPPAMNFALADLADPVARAAPRRSGSTDWTDSDLGGVQFSAILS